MRLESVAHYNNFSKQLREELESKIRSFGKVVRYKFNISHPNPDPTKYNGDTVYPNVYTLDPTRFSIIDPHEKSGASKSKLVAFIEELDENGKPSRFKKVRVKGASRGQILLRVEEDQDDFYTAMYLELHPKLKGGMFADKNSMPIVERIDEQAAAKEERELRKARKIAMDTAEEMTDKQVEDFADAMTWEQEDISILRNKVEELAEKSPELFNDLVSDKKMKYQAAIKRGIDNQVLDFDPSECRLSWFSNKHLIVSLGSNPGGGKNDVERLAEWMMTAGKQADETYKKLTSLSKEKAA